MLDYLSAASICAMHLSRLGAEIVLWSSDEFCFCELAEDFSSGSSIMPQKKNPDAAELLRAKAPRIASGFLVLTGVMHGLPLAYSKDLQEDKEALFDAVDSLELCLEAAERMLGGLSFDRERLAEAAADEFGAATDIADLLVRKGMPFREAHGVVGGLVREALEHGKALSELTREELGRHSELLDDSFYEALRPERWLESKRSAGGTASARLAEQLEAARAALRGDPAVSTQGSLRAGSTAEFFDRSVHDVARDLIGCALLFDGVGGVIVECESYERDDPACHAYVGLTERTEPLFGPPGRAYVYLSYGIHSCLNFVCEPEGAAAAVLIRALEPRWGIEEMSRRRGRDEARELCSGPGKLTEALGIGLEMNRAPLAEPPFELRARDRGWREVEVATGPRIGITRAAELPWRFCAAGSESSRGRCASGERVALARRDAAAGAARGLAPPPVEGEDSAGGCSWVFPWASEDGACVDGAGVDGVDGGVACSSVVDSSSSAAWLELDCSNASTTSLKISAGIVPPSTGPPPNSVSIGFTEFGVPDPDGHRDVLGAPTNHASPLFSVVPVLPTRGGAVAALVPVPWETTRSRIDRAVAATSGR